MPQKCVCNFAQPVLRDLTDCNAESDEDSSYLPLNVCEKLLSASPCRRSSVIPHILLRYVNRLGAHLGASSPQAAPQACN